MPELPEVECVRRSLAQTMTGAAITDVTVHRGDVVHLPDGPDSRRRTIKREDLLVGETITEIRRHGKELALIAGNGGVLRAHLGMTGSICVTRADSFKPREPTEPTHLATPLQPTALESRALEPPQPTHVHVIWHLGELCVHWRDPRRFGGLWVHDSISDLESRWAGRGPDALLISPSCLHARLRRTRRPLKAALLDQLVISGLGNIYIDELLHRARWHPLTPACLLRLPDVQAVVRIMRRLLRMAIERGGSSIRDYVNAEGQSGAYQQRHVAYGRAGQPCVRCGDLLDRLRIAGRTTVACARCQRLPSD